jgi:hypothetical protein
MTSLWIISQLKALKIASTSPNSLIKFVSPELGVEPRSPSQPRVLVSKRLFLPFELPWHFKIKLSGEVIILNIFFPSAFTRTF